MPMVGFPLLLIPIAIYNMIVFLMPGVTMLEPIARLQLMSGAEWQLTLSDMMLALGIVLLMFEVIKGARPGAKYLTDHLLSLVVFGGAAVEFVEAPRFGTSTYFLLALLALVDFLSGLALRARRATKAVEQPVSHQDTAYAGASAEAELDSALAALRLPAPPATAPAPALQVAASVAEAVLLDRPEPKFAQVAETIPTPPSPQVSSPGLQPGEGLLPSSGASQK